MRSSPIYFLIIFVVCAMVPLWKVKCQQHLNQSNSILKCPANSASKVLSVGIAVYLRWES